tara:strand:- start:12572 stop:12934 length:363 start_codon:yes stop_codon:yes gene_type:complete
MEGGPKQEQVASGAESSEYSESIERALDLYGQLKVFEGTDVVGQQAADEVEAIAVALKLELQNIPAAECLANGLPYHPTDEKPEAVVTPFPAQPDYPLPYEPPRSGVGYTKFGGSYQAAA